MEYKIPASDHPMRGFLFWALCVCGFDEEVLSPPTPAGRDRAKTDQGER